MSIHEALDAAVQHHRAGRLAEAEAIYRRILTHDPNHADALHGLGVLASQAGHVEAGLDLIRRAAALRPELVRTLIELGNRWRDEGKLDSALLALRHAAAVAPASAEAHYYLGAALWKARRPRDAAAALRRSIELQPVSAAAQNILGLALLADDQIDHAIAAYRRAIEINPGFFEAYINLGNALRSTARLTESLACFRKAVDLSDDPRAWDNLLFTLHYVPGRTARQIRDEHQRWDDAYVRPRQPPILPHAIDRTPDRRLRIGYVSPDFNRHPVARFLLPLIQKHDRAAVEVFCYSNVAEPDAQTQAFRSAADAWRDIRGLTDQHAAQAVRQDAIDILIDLSLHGEGNRLGLFAQKPAPVQATWLGYLGTTGLEAIDYRISDPFLDPLDAASDSDYLEKTIRLPHCNWCYRPPDFAPAVNASPAATNGCVTFGCLNNFAKVNADVVQTWAKILAALPGSRMVIHSLAGSHRDDVLRLFADAGVTGQRIGFVGFLPTDQYLHQYAVIDIALDPFPFGGGTTTFDALWMGVPVVTLIGQTAVGRGGTSVLSNLALTDLIAATGDQYVSIAVQLARDLPRLSTLRSTLRDSMARSALTHEKAFAAAMEAVFREMWKKAAGAVATRASSP